MSWLYYAISSSVLWGMSHAIGERLLRTINISTLMLFNAIGSLCFAMVFSFYKNNLKIDLQACESKHILMMLFCVIANTMAILFIYISTQQKNATMAGLIEISYPFFAALTAIILFNDKQLNVNSFIGTLFIIIGTMIISKF